MRNLVIHNSLKVYSENELSQRCKQFLLSISILFLFAMHLPIPSIGQIGLAFTANIMTWIAFSFVIGIGLYQIGSERQLKYSKLSQVYLLCCILLSLPIFYIHADWQQSYPRLIVLWGGMLFFVLLQQFNFKRKKAILLLFVLLAVLVEMGLGYTQILFFALNERFGFNTTALPLGIFQQADTTASFLATGLAISIYLLPFPSQLPTRLFLLSTPGFCLPLIFVLPSPIGWLASIIIVCAFIPYCYHHLNRKGFLAWLLSVVVGVFCATFLFKAIYSKDLISKINLQTLSSQVFPSDQRIQYKQFVDMFVARPIEGYGYGQFEKAYMHFTAKSHLKDPNYPAGYSWTERPKNEAMLWVLEGGILPLIAILLAVSATVLHIFRTKKFAAFIMFIPIILHSALGTPFVHSFVHWLVFIILLWSIDNDSIYLNRDLKFITHIMIKLASFIFPIIICMFMVLILQANYWLAKYEKSDLSNFALLNNIFVPKLVQKRLNINEHTAYLKAGIDNNQHKLVMLYIHWAQKMIKDEPRLYHYLMLMEAYRSLGDQQNFNSVQAQAEFLFPNTKYKDEFLEKT